jgi:hypothetical protein
MMYFQYKGYIFLSTSKDQSMIQRYILSLFCILLLSLLAYIPINSTAQNVVYEDLTGIWKGQDGSTYYVRHFNHPLVYNEKAGKWYQDAGFGHDIMWVGLSADDGKTWANVFVGKYNGVKITGTWADVPRGKFAASGTLTLEVWKPGNGYLMISKIGSTGSGFGTSTWEKPQCPSLEYEFGFCGWAVDLPIKKSPPGGPPLQPPPEFGKK